MLFRSTDVLAAHLTAASSIQEKNLPDLQVGLARGSRGPRVRDAQKLLRYLGYYRGRTDGHFDRDVRDAVLALQRQEGLITTDDDSGAGRIGPQTREAILRQWKARIVRAKANNLILKQGVQATVKTTLVPSKVLAKGDTGSDVRRLQRALRDLGYLPSKDMTGTFADRTEKALLQYQKDRVIITEQMSKGAGVFGPATRASLLKDITALEWGKVRKG